MKKKLEDVDMWDKIEKTHEVSNKQKIGIEDIFRSKLNMIIDHDKETGTETLSQLKNYNSRNRVLHYLYPEAYDHKGKRRGESAPIDRPRHQPSDLDDAVEDIKLDNQDQIDQNEGNGGKQESSHKTHTPQMNGGTSPSFIKTLNAAKPEDTTSKKSESKNKKILTLANLVARSSFNGGQTKTSDARTKNDFHFTPLNKGRGSHQIGDPWRRLGSNGKTFGSNKTIQEDPLKTLYETSVNIKPTFQMSGKHSNTSIEFNKQQQQKSYIGSMARPIVLEVVQSRPASQHSKRSSNMNIDQKSGLQRSMMNKFQKPSDSSKKSGGSSNNVGESKQTSNASLIPKMLVLPPESPTAKYQELPGLSKNFSAF
jgi:hypothetical protein